jgi:hypothetical protein
MKNLLLPISAAGVVSLLALGVPKLADANDSPRRWSRDSGRHQAVRHEVRQDRAEIRNDRAELRRDHAELQRDRADLRSLYRSGANRTDINNKRHEIRDGRREVAEGRRELRQDYAELRRDRSRFEYGNSGRFGGQHGWNRHDNGRWGRNERWGSHDRRGWR